MGPPGPQFTGKMGPFLWEWAPSGGPYFTGKMGQLPGSPCCGAWVYVSDIDGSRNGRETLLSPLTSSIIESPCLFWLHVVCTKEGGGHTASIQKLAVGMAWEWGCISSSCHGSLLVDQFAFNDNVYSHTHSFCCVQIAVWLLQVSDFGNLWVSAKSIAIFKKLMWKYSVLGSNLS